MKKILLPVIHEDDLAGLVVDGNIGWVRVSEATRLSTISGVLKLPAGETDNLVGDHSIPSPVAHIQHYTKRIVKATQYTNDLNEWFGIIAVIVLRDIYSFNVSFRNIPLNASFLGRIINDDLKKDVYFNNQNPPNDIANLQIVCFNDKPIAILHRSIFICPLKTYDPNAFLGVEWYDKDENGNAIWKDVKEVLKGNNSNILSGILVKLYRWLSSQCSNPANNQMIQNRLAVLRDYLSGKDTLIPPAIQANLVTEPKIPANLNIISSDLLQMCTLPVRIPFECFSKKILLVDKQTRDEDIHSMFTTRVENTNLTILPPLSDEIAKFTFSNDVTISNISYAVNMTDSERKTIKCEIKLVQEGVELVRTRAYEEDDMVYIKDFPYISLWPNIDLPDDNWKLYYMNITKKDIDVPTPNCLTKKIHKLENERIKFKVYNIENELINENIVDSSIKRDDQWSIFKSEKRAKFISFSYNSDGFDYSLGQIILDRTNIPAESKCRAFNSPAFIGVDFGATSTNCNFRIAHDGNIKPVSSGEKYLLNVTPPNTNNISSFREQCWVSMMDNSCNNGKFFTAGQLFQKSGGPGEQIPYIHGKTIYLDLELLSSFRSLKDPLSHYGIFTNLKFQDIHEAGVVEKQKAILVLLKNLMTIATLEARLMGALTFTINVSYAFGAAFESLRLTWQNFVIPYIMQINNLTTGVTLNSYTEAYAAGQFYNSLGAGTMAIVNNGYTIIDIGGGTTDISLWQGNELDKAGHPIMNKHLMKSKASIKYAGGKLVVRSIFQSMRNNPKFKDMWDAKGNIFIKTLIDTFEEDTVSIDGLINYTDPSYQTIQSILDVLIEKAQVNYNALALLFQDYALLVSLVRIKYFSLFYIIAAYIKSKIANNEFVPRDTLQLFLAGCGSKGLKFCIQNDNMENFETTIYGQAVCNMIRKVSGLPDNVILQIVPPQTQNKEEVVRGLVNIGDTQGGKEPNEENASAGDVATQRTSFENNYIEFYQILNENEGLFKIPKLHGFDNLVQLLSIDNKEIKMNYLRHCGFAETMLVDNTRITSINPQKDIIKECFTTLMIDSLLENNISQMQQGRINNN